MTPRNPSIPTAMVCLFIALCAGTPFTCTAAQTPKARAVPGLEQAALTRGTAAIAAWEAHLPAIAQAHGKTLEELISILLEDRTAGVDRHGRLLYTDDHLPPPQPGDTVPEAAAAGAAPFALEDTFLLHSRPGVSKVIYLDFDGHVMSGTAWNAGYNSGLDINCPAFDFEGGPGVFTDNERARIQLIWARVAEDYAPFDVDVTTEYPGEAALTRSSSSDSNYGMRVLISPISSYFGNYGGIAYVGAFNDVGDYYKPALVFPENLGPNGEKYVAEAASHENGHTVGLSHDGTTTGTTYYAGHGSGDTGWAPIMGNGYYKNVTQWSKGEYANANNTQDDLAIIATYVPYLSDDHGNDANTATALPPGASLSADGVIESNTDVDVFMFQTGAGAISLNVAPVNPGPNLDVFIELFDSSGALVASSNPGSLLGATLNLTVAAGTYYLRLSGAAYATPSTGYSSYASLGQYILSGTVVDPVDVPPPSDTTPPTPNPMTWATPPAATGPSSITMTATTASDFSGVEYYFACAAGGGHDSGWQTSPTYTDTGLTAGLTYTYAVLARDKSVNLNETVWSSTASATTPLPATMHVESITLTAPKSGKNYAGRATVVIYDNLGKPVSGATVTGQFTGGFNEVRSATTDATGKAVLTTATKSRSIPSFTFCVQKATHSAFTYDAAANKQTCASR
jgi:hypothetical protein